MVACDTVWANTAAFLLINDLRSEASVSCGRGDSRRAIRHSCTVPRRDGGMIHGILTALTRDQKARGSGEASQSYGPRSFSRSRAKGQESSCGAAGCLS